MPAIEVRDLTKHFRKDRPALDGVSFDVAEGEMVALIGASGSGKSTLIRHIAGLVAADRRRGDCEICVGGKRVQGGGHIAGDIRHVRARMGVIFQQFNLVGRLLLLTNVVLGSLRSVPGWRGNLGLFTREEKLRAMAALDRVGMADYAGQRASTLSGGQQQRAAIARALVQDADVILADEPIASLDPKSARRVMEVLASLNREEGITCLVSLHQVEYAIEYCPRTIALRDGKLVFDGPSKQLTPAFLSELYGTESEELFLPGIAGMVAPHAVPQGANGAKANGYAGNGRAGELETPATEKTGGDGARGRALHQTHGLTLPAVATEPF